MRALRPYPLAAVVLAAAAAACADGGPAPVRHQVEIRAFVFSPDTLPAHPGDTVVFVNHDAVPHTATSAKWDTGEIPANGSKTVVIPADGAVPYHCAFHPTMHGDIEAR